MRSAHDFRDVVSTVTVFTVYIYLFPHNIDFNSMCTNTKNSMCLRLRACKLNISYITYTNSIDPTPCNCHRFHQISTSISSLPMPISVHEPSPQSEECILVIKYACKLAPPHQLDI